MRNKGLKDIKEVATDELTQVHSRLTYLEDKLKKLLNKEEKRIKDELEITIESSYEIIIDNRVKTKQIIGNKTGVNKKYLDEIVRKCKEGVFVIDKMGNIKVVNRKIVSLLGYKREDFKDMTIESIFPLLGQTSGHPDVFTRQMRFYYRREEYKYPYIERTVLDKNKNTIFFQVKASILKDSNEQMMGAVFLMRDFSERKKVEDEIKKGKGKLEKIVESTKWFEIIERLKKDLDEKNKYIDQLFESSLDGILIGEANGIMKRVNTAYAKLMDYSPHELIGKHPAELSHLEDKEYPTTYGEKINGSAYIKDFLENKMVELITKEKAYYEGYLKRKDGVLVPIWTSVSWIRDDKGQKMEGLNIVRDLTEKRKAEMELKKAYNELQEANEYLENIFNNSTDGIAVFNWHEGGKLSFYRINKSFGALFGYEESDLLGRNLEFLLPGEKEEYRLQFHKFMKAFIQERKILYYELHLRDKSGRIIPVETNGGFIKNKEGVTLGAELIFRNLTERKRAKEIEMKNEFLHEISHELRTPLTSIKGSLDNLLDGIAGELNDAQKEYLEIMNNESNRLVRLINDLLELNKLEVGSITITPEETEYISIVAQAVYNLKNLAFEKGLSIDIESSTSQLYLKADRDRMNQILINLISNAKKFTEQGGIKVIVEDHVDHVVTRIVDTGMGIPKDELERVFDKFYQLRRVDSKKNKGTGLGLTITKSLVELHGGKIWVESEEGKGSEFCFRLPKRIR